MPPPPLPHRGGDYVEAALPYLARSPSRPFRYTYDPPPGTPKEGGQRDPRTARIWNAWTQAPGATLEVEGFAIGVHPTRFADFDSEAAIRERYYPEMEQLVLAAAGARRAIIFDHNVRHLPSVAQPGRSVGKPARLAHNDYTEGSGPQRLQELIGAEQARARAGARFAFINLWRPILEPLQDSPLAVCDARSVAPQDLIASELIYPDRRGEVYQLAFNPQHRWFYFPRQMRDELLFIKCFDSLVDGRARFTPHTAFDDPDCPRDAPPRHSIEVRALVLW